MEKLNLKKVPLIIAVVGKGGVGKTIITTLLAKIISLTYRVKMLLIDADPTHSHLSEMVKLIPKKSVEEIRLNSIQNALNNEKSPQFLAENIDFAVYNAMAENKDFCLLSIGRPEGPGCFCPSNTLLKRVIESISKDFDLVLIDCEAGLEQVNRMVIKTVDIVLIITDISLRSVETANLIRNSAKKFTNYKKLGVIVNRVKGDIGIILKKIEEFKLSLIGLIPEDPNITKYDLEGKPLVDLPQNSISLLDVKKIIKNLLEI
ncbi:MAG TPA: AAA family ATPase [Candidatus Lokiarchaeia archaeon]